MNTRRKVFETIARKFEEHSLNWSVAHGAEGYPERLGRDLDILISKSDSDLAVKLAIQCFRDSGWEPGLYKMAVGVDQIIAFKRESGSIMMAEVDILRNLSLRWGPKTFIDQPSKADFCEMKGPFRIDLWGSFVKRGLIQVLSGNFKKFKRKPHELEFSKKELLIARDQLSKHIGNKNSKELIDAFRSKDVSKLKFAAQQVRRHLLLKFIYPMNWVSSFREFRRWTKSEISLNFPKNKGIPIVALVGPDGVGKSTTIECLVEILEKQALLPKTKLKHWRPNLLPRLGFFVGKPAPVPKADGSLMPRRKKGHLGGLRVLYYALDYLFGGFFDDRIESSRLTAVIYDRCMLDMVVDPLRYGLSGFWGGPILGFWRIVPKPDLVILLSGEADEIFRRKKELSKDEIREQLELWRNLQREGLVEHEIEVLGNPADVAHRIMILFIDKFLEMHAASTSAAAKFKRKI